MSATFQSAARRTLLLLLVGFILLGVYFFYFRAERRAPDGAKLVYEYFSHQVKKIGIAGRRDNMALVKVLELVGESNVDWQDAAAKAVAEAAKSVNNITGVEVCNWTANVRGGKIVEYKANVKVAYVE